MKKIENRPTFVKVMNECIVAQFFLDSLCIYVMCLCYTTLQTRRSVSFLSFEFL